MIEEHKKRDKRSPPASSESVKKCMQGNKNRNTSPELLLRKKLFSAGIRGYRLHWKIQGNPDVAFVGKKICIFIHGCFWHRCPHCNLPIPKINTSFWLKKFERNLNRDKRNLKLLSDLGWKPIIIWECQLKKRS
jgi:DNA mismatch endonuclease (patch repair protein)